MDYEWGHHTMRVSAAEVVAVVDVGQSVVVEDRANDVDALGCDASFDDTHAPYPQTSVHRIQSSEVTRAGRNHYVEISHCHAITLRRERKAILVFRACASRS